MERYTEREYQYLLNEYNNEYNYELLNFVARRLGYAVWNSLYDSARVFILRQLNENYDYYQKLFLETKRSK